MITTVTHQQDKIIKKSFKEIAPKGEQIVSRFVDKLFETDPQVRGLFPENVTEQSQQIIDVVKLIAHNAVKLNTIEDQLVEIGRRFISYGLTTAQLDIVRNTIVSTFAEVVGESWNSQIADAWTSVFSAVVETFEQTGQIRQAA